MRIKCWIFNLEEELFTIRMIINEMKNKKYTTLLEQFHNSIEKQKILHRRNSSTTQ
jgi:hypothetical protein